MSDRFQIKYTEVYSKTAELRSRIESELSNMDAAYRQAQSDLHGLDGKTNATFMETIEQNKMKAHVTAETLHKLLTFIELSSRQVEHDELKMKGMYSMAKAGGSSSPGAAAATEAATTTSGAEAATATATEVTNASSSSTTSLPTEVKYSTSATQEPTTATQGGAS